MSKASSSLGRYGRWAAWGLLLISVILSSRITGCAVLHSCELGAVSYRVLSLDVIWLAGWMALSTQALLLSDRYRTGWTLVERGRDVYKADDRIKTLAVRHPELLGLLLYVIGPGLEAVLYLSRAPYLYVAPAAGFGHSEGLAGTDPLFYRSTWLVLAYLLASRAQPYLSQWGRKAGTGALVVASMCFAFVSVHFTLDDTSLDEGPVHEIWFPESRTVSKYVGEYFVEGSGSLYKVINGYALSPTHWDANFYHTTNSLYSVTGRTIHKADRPPDSLEIHILGDDTVDSSESNNSVPNPKNLEEKLKFHESKSIKLTSDREGRLPRILKRCHEHALGEWSIRSDSHDILYMNKVVLIQYTNRDTLRVSIGDANRDISSAYNKPTGFSARLSYDSGGYYEERVPCQYSKVLYLLKDKVGLNIYGLND